MQIMYTKIILYTFILLIFHKLQSILSYIIVVFHINPIKFLILLYKKVRLKKINLPKITVGV